MVGGEGGEAARVRGPERSRASLTPAPVALRIAAAVAVAASCKGSATDNNIRHRFCGPGPARHRHGCGQDALFTRDSATSFLGSPHWMRSSITVKVLWSWNKTNMQRLILDKKSLVRTKEKFGKDKIKVFLKITLKKYFMTK